MNGKVFNLIDITYKIKNKTHQFFNRMAKHVFTCCVDRCKQISCRESFSKHFQMFSSFFLTGLGIVIRVIFLWIDKVKLFMRLIELVFECLRVFLSKSNHELDY